ncbi:uncharacterized protein [Channa argus]
MSCGHAVTPMSLTKWCRRLLEQGESKFVCGRSGCNVQWPYAEVCKMALLTPEEMKYFEKTMCTNSMSHYTKICPGCKSSVVGTKRYNLRVHSTAQKGQASDLCWQCLKKPKAPAPSSDRCENESFTNELLNTLRMCPEISLDSVKGVTGCPSMRACPTCGIMLQHDNKHCKKVVCPRCMNGFCFVCLKPTAVCLKNSSPYGPCSSGLAPRQTSIPVWQSSFE